MRNKLAVIGKDVSRSLSPEIHNYWLKKYSIDANYEAISLDEKDLGNFLSIASNNYIGFNITMPFKVKILDFIDEIDEQAKIIGSINTLKYIDSQIKGYNTDIVALNEINKDLFSKYKIEEIMVIGNGGITKTLLYLYKILYPVKNIFLVSTKHDDNVSCVDGVTLCSYQNYIKFAGKVDIIINATPFNQKIEGINYDHFKENCIYFDLNYLESDLLVRAKRKFAYIFDGKKMFVYQARSSFYHWFNFYPECDDYIWNQIVKL